MGLESSHTPVSKRQRAPNDTEREKVKFYLTSWSFWLCNSAFSLQSLGQIGLRKLGLTILGTGAYLPHPCPAYCNRPASANPLNNACLCIKTATPLFGAQNLKVLTPLGPPA